MADVPLDWLTEDWHNNIMNILVGYIPTPQAEAALVHAIQEAQIHNSKIVILNVSRGDAAVESQILSETQEDALRRQLDGAGIEYEIRKIVARREFSDEIIDTALEIAATSIVIGLRRRSLVGKFVMGSTAHRVLVKAECAVVSVKAETDE